MTDFTATMSMSQEVLNAHNGYRASVGVGRLSWSTKLAREAQQWANHLAATNSCYHSNSGGENLWEGAAGHYTYTQMVQSWGNERQYFRSGAFPHVSTTGRWEDVGHYTQMIWGGTTEMGCGCALGRDGRYRLVCRYSPAGNVMGRRI